MIGSGAKVDFREPRELQWPHEPIALIFEGPDCAYFSKPRGRVIEGTFTVVQDES